ncbi:MAG: hypothetical protein K2Y22_13160 [Candidatus Obscuribacterales bacterium]|nr:hypothetical protein [Candidatus Obscuribacterales bacterium]
MKRLCLQRLFAGVAASFLLLTTCLPPALAQEAAAQAAQSATAAAVNLDLSSTEASVMVQSVGQAAAVHVDMAGTMVPITAGAQVTPAQFVALQQIMQTGTQTLMLNAMGAAQSGTFSMNSALTSMMGNLTIPSGVTALHDAAGASMVNLTGNLVNSGAYYAYTSNAAVTAATLAAQNITNNQSAIISTILPAALQASLNPALTSLSLNLSAINNIVNAGTISSAANLNLYAGGSIINSLPPGATGPSPVMMAMQALNMTALNGAIQNSGVMAAMLGNINVQAAQTANMTLNNVNGVLQALNGSINIRDSLMTTKVNTSLYGGDYIAKQLNIYSGEGAVDVNVRDISGVARITAGIAHVMTANPTLKLGEMNLSGDPTYFNTGDIQITGNILVGEALSIVSGGSIYIPNGTTVNRIQANSATTGQGFDVTIIAGANITGGTGSTGAISGSPPSGAATSPVTISGPSLTGGDIDFSASPNMQISSCSGCSPGPACFGCVGRNITLAAYSGTGGGGGHVIAPNVFVVSGSSGNGDVNVIAGANTAAPIVDQTGATVTDAIVFGNSLTFGSNNTGNINLYTAQPSTNPIVFGTNGAITSGSITPQTTLKPTNIQFSRFIFITGGLRAYAGGNLSVANGAALQVSNNGPLTLAAKGNVFLDANLSSRRGGMLSIIAGQDIQSLSEISIDTVPTTFSGTPVNAGAMNFIAGADFSISPTYDIVIAPGASATGGNISLSSVRKIDSHDSTNFLGSGGDINFVALANGVSGGTITLPGFGGNTVFSITTGGDTPGQNGNVTIIAGSPSTATTITSQPGCTFCLPTASINTAGGTAGNGNITIASATPEIVCPGCPTTNITISFSGVQTGFYSAGALQPGDILLNALTTPSKSLVQLFTQGTVTSGAVTACAGCALVGGDIGSTVVGCAGCTVVADTNIPSATLAAINATNVANITIATVNSGDIIIGNGSPIALSASNSLRLIANGSGDITQFLTSTLSTANFTAVSVSGNVGTPAAPLVLLSPTAQPINISASAGGNVYLAPTGSVNLASGYAGGTGQTYYVHTTANAGGNGRIFVVGSLTATNGTLDLQASSSGTGQGGIIGGPLSPVLTANNILLFDIGTSTAVGAGNINGQQQVQGGTITSPLLIDASDLSINTSGAVIIENLSSSITINQLVCSSFEFVGAGDLLVNTPVDSAGGPLLLSTTGNLGLGANLTSTGGNILLIAGGDIYTFQPNVSITSTPTSPGSGAQINIIAGTVFFRTGNQYAVGGASATGGNINLNNGNPVIALSSVANGSGDGGNINIIAYASSGGLGGSIVLPPTLTVTADASGPGFANGNVLIVAGALSTASSIGSVSAGLGTNYGSVTFASATPSSFCPICAGNFVTISNGAVFPNNGIFAATTLLGAPITVSGNISSSGIVQLFSTNSVTVTGTVTANPNCTGCIIAGTGTVNCPSCGAAASGTNLAINGPGPLLGPENLITFTGSVPSLFIQAVGGLNTYISVDSLPGLSISGNLTLAAPMGSIFHSGGGTTSAQTISLYALNNIFNDASTLTSTGMMTIAAQNAFVNSNSATVQGDNVAIVTGQFFNDSSITATGTGQIAVLTQRASNLVINPIGGTLTGNTVFFMNATTTGLGGTVELFGDQLYTGDAFYVFASGDINADASVTQISAFGLNFYAGAQLNMPSLTGSSIDILGTITGNSSSSGGNINLGNVSSITSNGFGDFFGARAGGPNGTKGRITMATAGLMTVDDARLLAEANGGQGITIGDAVVTSDSSSFRLITMDFPTTAGILPSAPIGLFSPLIKDADVTAGDISGGLNVIVNSKGNNVIANILGPVQLLAATFKTFNVDNINLVTKFGIPTRIIASGTTANIGAIRSNGIYQPNPQSTPPNQISITNLNYPSGPTPPPPPPPPPSPPAPLPPTQSRPDPNTPRRIETTFQPPVSQTNNDRTGTDGKTPLDFTPFGDVADIPQDLIDWLKDVIPRDPNQTYDDWAKDVRQLAQALNNLNSQPPNVNLPEDWWDDWKNRVPREHDETYDAWKDRAQGMAQQYFNGDMKGLMTSLRNGKERIDESKMPWNDMGNIIDNLKSAVGKDAWAGMSSQERNGLIQGEQGARFQQYLASQPQTPVFDRTQQSWRNATTKSYSPEKINEMLQKQGVKSIDQLRDIEKARANSPEQHSTFELWKDSSGTQFKVDLFSGDMTPAFSFGQDGIIYGIDTAGTVRADDPNAGKFQEHAQRFDLSVSHQDFARADINEMKGIGNDFRAQGPTSAFVGNPNADGSGINKFGSTYNPAVTGNANINNYGPGYAGYNPPTTGNVGSILPGKLSNIYNKTDGGEYQLDNKAGSNSVKQALGVMGQMQGTQDSIGWSSAQSWGQQCSNCHLTAQSVVTGQDLHADSKEAAINANGGFGKGNMASATDMAQHGWVQTPVNWDNMSQIDHIGSLTYQYKNDVQTSHSATIIKEGQNTGMLERSGAGYSPTLINKTDFANVHLVDSNNNPVSPQDALASGMMKVYVPDTKTSQIQDPDARASQQQAIMDHARMTDVGQGGIAQDNLVKSFIDPNTFISNSKEGLNTIQNEFSKLVQGAQQNAQNLAQAGNQSVQQIQKQMEPLVGHLVASDKTDGQAQAMMQPKSAPDPNAKPDAMDGLIKSMVTDPISDLTKLGTQAFANTSDPDVMAAAKQFGTIAGVAMSEYKFAQPIIEMHTDPGAAIGHSIENTIKATGNTLSEINKAGGIGPYLDTKVDAMTNAAHKGVDAVAENPAYTLTEAAGKGLNLLLPIPGGKLAASGKIAEEVGGATKLAGEIQAAGETTGLIGEAAGNQISHGNTGAVQASMSDIKKALEQGGVSTQDIANAGRIADSDAQPFLSVLPGNEHDMAFVQGAMKDASQNGVLRYDAFGNPYTATGVEMGYITPSAAQLKGQGTSLMASAPEGTKLVVSGGPDRINFGSEQPLKLDGHTHTNDGFAPSSLDWDAQATTNQVRESMGLPPSNSQFIVDVPTGYTHTFGSQTMTVPGSPIPVGQTSEATKAITLSGNASIEGAAQVPYGSFTEIASSDAQKAIATRPEAFSSAQYPTLSANPSSQNSGLSLGNSSNDRRTPINQNRFVGRGQQASTDGQASKFVGNRQGQTVQPSTQSANSNSIPMQGINQAAMPDFLTNPETSKYWAPLKNSVEQFGSGPAVISKPISELVASGQEKAVLNLIEQAPGNYTYYASGTEGIVFKNETNDIIRVGPRETINRPQSDLVLQPNRTANVGNYTLEQLPFAPSQGLSTFDVKTMANALAEKGLSFKPREAIPQNIGRVQSGPSAGKIVVTDPNAVYQIPKGAVYNPELMAWEKPSTGPIAVDFRANPNSQHADKLHQRVALTWNASDGQSALMNDFEPIYIATADLPAPNISSEDTISENAVAGLIAASNTEYSVTVTSGNVKCPKGSCVFIRDRGRDVGIYVFEKSSNGDVVFKGRDGHYTKLQPGRFLFISTGHNVTAEDVNPVSIIGLRGIEEIKLSKEFKAFTGDFSIMAACMQLPHFKNMLSSKTAAERKMAEGILKNVAILGQITAGDGPFKQLR